MKTRKAKRFHPSFFRLDSTSGGRRRNSSRPSKLIERTLEILKAATRRSQNSLHEEVELFEEGPIGRK